MRSEVQEKSYIKAVESEEVNFFRYAVVLEYIGTSYAGSQVQPDQKTVQSELESVLKILVNSPVKTIFSGRTDSGVHSKGQVAHFNLPKRVEIKRFINSLNALLPSDISINAMSEVDKSFHSQKSAKYRWYRFKINNSSQRSVWSRETYHVRESLDIDAMNEALAYLIGKHDFSSFKNTNSMNPAKECIMYIANCNRDKEMITVDIVGNRFLYNMVRIIIGTLVEVGKGIVKPEHMKYVLDAKDRTIAGPTVSPEGLTLMYVDYTSENNICDFINKEANKDENIFSKAS